MPAANIPRRRFLKNSARLIGGGAVLGAFSAWEAHRPVLERVEIRSPRVPPPFDGFTIAQLTDLHYDEYLHDDYFQHAVDVVNGLRPNVVALTGDYVTTPLSKGGAADAAHRQAPPCARIMARLRSTHGTFAVLGNHDHSTAPVFITQMLQAEGVPVLMNDARAIERDGARIWFCGVDSYFSRNYRPAQTLAQCAPGDFRIVLLHEPDCADDVAKIGADLMLAGHSHGGQVRIPLLGAPVLPAKARKYVMGLHRVGDLQLYTSRGLGVIHLPFRFACPPEITLLTLRRTA